MASASQVIKSALQRILVQASEADLEPDEYQDAMFSMNNYMLSLDASGISLGYTEVKNLGDEVTIPLGALRGLIANLAIEISPDYNGIVSTGLATAAIEGLKAMRMIGQSTPTSSMPATLPIGSGNEHAGLQSDNHFYPGEEAAILDEYSGYIGLEDNTAHETEQP
jgi:hypothetical protein